MEVHSDFNTHIPSQVCGFRVNNDIFGIDVGEVQEVIKPQPLTAVPRSPEYIKGLINLRGQIVTAVSVRKLLGLPIDENAHFMNIIVRGKGGVAALMVDEILDVIDVDRSCFESMPGHLSQNLRDISQGIFKTPNGLVTLIDLNKLEVLQSL